MSRLSTDKQNRLRKYFKQKEVAAALGVSTTTLRALIERGELTAVVVAGNCIRIPADELERFLQQRRIGRSFYLRPNRLPMSDEPEDAQAAENPPARPELKERLPKAKPPRKARRYPPRITSLKATRSSGSDTDFPVGLHEESSGKSSMLTMTRRLTPSAHGRTFRPR